MDGRQELPDGSGASSQEAPLRVELFMDYHCPYSYRVAGWLDDLGPARVAVRARLVALEQFNRDAAATEWRLWEQSIDYVHHRQRQNRRSLTAFLATAIVEAAEPAEVASRFRRDVYAARFIERDDIGDPAVLARLADVAGAAPRRIRDGFADPAAITVARRRLAEDWAAARSEYAIFGVPTLRFGTARPYYLRLADRVEPADGRRVLDALLAFRADVPDLLELKLPEPIAPD